MMTRKVPFIKLKSNQAELNAAIQQVMEGEVFLYGDATTQFKLEFSAFMDMPYVIPTANCTDALEVILRAIEVTSNDEVMVPAFSWFSDASVVKLVNGNLRFADINLSHFGMDLAAIQEGTHEKTKAIILPHLFGIVHPEIKQISQFCSARNIILIEDCAQAHGATLNGKLAGSFGDIAAFSFYPTKNLGALGDAGCIITNNETLAEKCQLLANHGQKQQNEHRLIGRNSRMDELQAAILCAKLPFLEKSNQERIALANIYFEQLKGLPICLPQFTAGHVYHQFVIRTEKRNALKAFLTNAGIETSIHYPHALSDLAVFQNEAFCKNASLASQTVLSLPIYPTHDMAEISYVAKKIQEFFKI